MRWLLGLLEALLPAVRVNGVHIDQRVRALLWLVDRRAPLEELGPEGARAASTRSRDALPKVQVDVATHDFTAEGLAMRRYAPPGGTPRAGLLYFHGGGFVIGDLDSHDLLCRMLALHSGVEVVSVAYRLAPEHPFPAAVEDAERAWAWFSEQPYRRRLIGGDSAGGNLAAVVCQTARPDGQLLIYPATDRHDHRSSRDTYGRGFLYTQAMSTWFKDLYLPPSVDRSHPRVSPLRAEDLSGHPPAHVLVAGFDILRDEVEAYVGRLEEAGVPVTVQREDSLPHGFTALVPVSPACSEAVLRAAAGLKRLADDSTPS